MITIRSSSDPEECARIWAQLWPQECLFDLWPVRMAFASAYGSTPFFILAGDRKQTTGLLALAETGQAGCYGFFPGEVWQNKTWLEQNKIPASCRETRAELLAAAPGRLHLRYMLEETVAGLPDPMRVDETGFLFHPPRLDYSFTAHLQRFPGKSRKQLLREVAALEELGLEYRCNHLPDLEPMFRMNRDNFGAASYFADDRFVRSFELLTGWLHSQDMLRLTTVLLGGRIAAVDIGAIWCNHYTLLGGSTHPDFPGVAKLINLHHLQFACEKRLHSVDFLCGDFNWKKRFRLDERPLYELIRPIPEETAAVSAETESNLASLHG